MVDIYVVLLMPDDWILLNNVENVCDLHLYLI